MGVANYSPFPVLAQLVTITATGSPSAGQTYTLMCVGSLVGNTSITPVVSWKNSNGVITNGGSIIVSGGNLTINLTGCVCKCVLALYVCISVCHSACV